MEYEAVYAKNNENRKTLRENKKIDGRMRRIENETK
jgi:hypothetical protein